MTKLSPQEIYELISSNVTWDQRNLDACEVYENIDFSGFDFSNFLLRRRKFVNCRVNNCKLIRTNLNHSRFVNCEIHNSTASYATLYNTVFINCSMKNINLQYSVLNGTAFKRCNLQGADFKSSNLSDSTFSNCSIKNKKIKVGKLYSLHDFTFGPIWNTVTFKEGQVGMILNVKKEESFDILVADKIYRDVKNWVKYSGINEEL